MGIELFGKSELPIRSWLAYAGQAIPLLCCRYINRTL